jgi:hypothetical protein
MKIPHTLFRENRGLCRSGGKIGKGGEYLKGTLMCNEERNGGEVKRVK